MTTQEVADRLIEMVLAGQNLQAEEELYSPDVVSYEQDGTVARGLEAVMAKTKAAMEGVGEFFGIEITQRYVGADSFLIWIQMDVAFKGAERMQVGEWGFYKVENGKVVEEHFFMKPSN